MAQIPEFITYLSNTTLSEKTKEAYINSVKHYHKFFDEVNTENINKYKSICLQINKPNTINLRLHAIQVYASSQNIEVGIKYIKIQDPIFSENILTRKEYEKLISYLLKNKKYDWYLLIKVLACTGVRLHESKQILIKDLKNSRKVILGKGTKTRVIWFPYQMREEVKSIINLMDESKSVLCHDESYVRAKMKKLKKTLKLKCDLTPHEFRRFYAREVYNKTKDLYLVKDLLGHSSVKTTSRYLKTTVTNVSRKMSKVVDW